MQKIESSKDRNGAPVKSRSQFTPVSLEDVLAHWQQADANHRAAALAALQGITAAPTPGRALNLTAAAYVAGVSRCTIWRAIKAGALKASPLFHGGRPRVIESELNRWLTAGGAR